MKTDLTVVSRDNIRSPAPPPLGILKVANRDDPAAIHEQLSAERLRDFHDTRRILVIDDVAASLDRVADLLTPLYAVVDRESNPKEALRRINEAQNRGQAYDAIVVDLYMPGMLGSELIGKLESEPPAVVINTASMMAPIVADLRMQIDSYSSSCGQALFDAYRNAREACGLPTVAILTHHKLEDLGSLVDQIDSAMLIRSFPTDSTAQFLASYNPKIREITFSEEVVHRFCEDLQIFVRQMAEIAPELERSGFYNSPWWQKNGSTVQFSMKRLEAARYSSAFGETPAQTVSNLHCLVGELALGASPPGKYGADLPGAMAIHKWQEAWHSAKASLERLFEAIVNHSRGELNLEDLVKSVCPECAMPDSGPSQKKVLVKDPDMILPGFITSVLNAHRERVGNYEQDGTYANLFLHKEEDQYKKYAPEEFVRRFHDIQCGSYYHLTLSDQVTRPIDDDFQAVHAQLAMFQRSGMGFFEVFQREFGNQIEIYVKVSEKTQDYLAEIERKKEQATKQPDGSWTLDTFACGELPVQEDLGDKRDIVTVGFRKEDFLSLAAPIVYQAEGVRIVAGMKTSGLHMKAAHMVMDYLAERLSRNGDPRAEDYEGSKTMTEIYQRCIRLKILNGKVIISAPLAKSKLAYRTLLELGVPKERIIVE